jgi:hypothetical protein
LFWLILIPIVGAPAVDTGGDAFRAASGDIPLDDFTFKAGLRATGPGPPTRSSPLSVSHSKLGFVWRVYVGAQDA